MNVNIDVYCKWWKAVAIDFSTCTQSSSRKITCGCNRQPIAWTSFRHMNRCVWSLAVQIRFQDLPRHQQTFGSNKIKTVEVFMWKNPIVSVYLLHGSHHRLMSKLSNNNVLCLVMCSLHYFLIVRYWGLIGAQVAELGLINSQGPLQNKPYIRTHMPNLL